MLVEPSLDRITITHLARNLADVVNRVLYRGERFLVTRGDRPAVELVPPPRSRRLGDLPGILRTVPHLGEEDAARMARELDESRAGLGSVPDDPWEG
jgi:antitoxin (DNA-binding transcriptional repressor) of toxin-antitoxin stability system